MPIGPSHSHSSGGSHGGSYSGGFSSGRIHFSPHSFIFFGRPIHLSGRAGILLFFIISFVITVIITGVGGILMNNAKNSIVTFEQDAVEYKEIIDRARAHELDNTVYTDYGIYTISGIKFEENGEGYNEHIDEDVTLYKVTGPSNKYKLYADSDIYKNGVFWYYIEFSVNDDISFKGSTYTEYSQNQILSMTSLELAYHNNGSSIDVINADYNLNSNQQYLNAKSTESTGRIMMIVGGVISAILLFLIIFVGVKQMKKSNLEDSQKQAEIEQTKARTEQEKAKLKEINRVCEYCGSLVPDGERKCPACGSSKFKN